MTQMYETVMCNSARELVEFLSPLHNKWGSGTYIFRGQGNAGYSLIPSACRRGPGSIAHGSARKSLSTSTSAQVIFELDLLRHFLTGCDKAGLIVPGYDSTKKMYLQTLHTAYETSGHGWPDSIWYEPLAAAQHYGVPTRLLDWSKRSFVAAFFAASSADFMTTSESSIAVWALDISDCKEWTKLKLIDTPGGTSRNQAAQSGVFTLQTVPNLSNNEIYCEKGLEESEQIYRTAELKGKSSPLIQILLPVTQAPALLDLLAMFSVESSVLFPGFEGVANSVKDWAKQLIGVRVSDEGS